jgi:glyoxylase-like metal-dependent hydrolase (beta-lactamase superfamily II)
MINIKTIVNNGLQVNTYILYEENKSVIIDPGIDSEKAVKFLKSNDLKPKLVLLTHAHYDHIEGLPIILNNYDIPFRLHRDDEDLYYHNDNMGINSFNKPKIKEFLKIKPIEIFSTPIEVIHTPGHTQGSVCFYIHPYLFSGDTLFYGSIGRTDLPGGNFEQLIDSIKNRILKLPDDVKVLPGHSESTTIEFEKENNPYLQ